MKRIKCLLAVCSLCFALLINNHCLAANTLIAGVSISEHYFNPNVNQKVTISLAIKQRGDLTVQILDRDGFSVRGLCKSKPVDGGQIGLEWDGRDEAGIVVADEAYSLHVVMQGNGKTDTYFPANKPEQSFPVKSANYDRNSAILSYKIDKPSRIHLLAASSKIDPKTHHIEGPMLRTIVNQEPRVAGALVEVWNGLDESATIRVVDQPNFVVSIAATPLPENAIVTWGNRAKKFIETVSSRNGSSLYTYSVLKHEDHQGLSTLQDHSPTLLLKPINATWQDSDRHWLSDEERLEIACSVDGPSAAEFLKQPGKLKAYINGKKTLELDFSAIDQTIVLPIQGLASGEYIVAINMVSDYGPIALNAFRLKLTKKDQAVNRK